jgi:hypothetical protein
MKFNYWLLLLLATIASIVCAIACNPSSSTDDDDTTVDDDASPADDDDDNTSATWTDPATGLVWQVTPSTTAMLLADAETYCSGLTLGGLSDWRVPDINAMRTLVRSCAATATGGACGVTDNCLDSSGTTCDNSACAGCASGSGPAGGCYWPSQLAGSCTGANAGYISTSIVADYTIAAWGVDYSLGAVKYLGVHDANSVRCVH